MAELLEPLENGLKKGYKVLNVNSPKVAEITTAYKDLFLSKGIKIDEKSLYQYPASIERYIKIDSPLPFAGELGEIHNKIINTFDSVISAITTGYLIKPATAARNALAGVTQGALVPLTHFYEGLLGAGFTPVKEDIKSFVTSFSPRARKELPKEVLGSNFYSELITKGSVTSGYSKLLIPFSGIETHFKRVSFNANLNSMAIKVADKMRIIPSQRKEFIKDFRENYFVDLFHFLSSNSDAITYNYDNKPLFLKHVPRSIVPFPNHLYHKFRMYLEYSPLAFMEDGKTQAFPEIEIEGDKVKFKKATGWKQIRNKIGKALAGYTLWKIAWGLTDKVVKEREKYMEELSETKLPYEFDTTGRIRVYTDNKKIDMYLRAYDWPFVGDILFWREIKQGSADFGDWMSDGLSLGPMAILPLTALGFRSKWSKFDKTSTALGKEVAGYIPFGAFLRYIRMQEDKKMRKLYCKDFNAFVNFMSPTIDSIPGASRLLPEKKGKDGETRRYNIPTETLKFFFMNLKSIDQQEFLEFKKANQKE